MKAQCPHCGFEGSIRDELIPESGRNISCPKCKKTFFVQRKGVLSQQPLPNGEGTDRARTAAIGPQVSPRSDSIKKTNPLLIVVMAVLFLVLGFYAGYQYRGFADGKPEIPTMVGKPKKTPKKPPSDITPLRETAPAMTPMGTPGTSIPPGNPEKPSELGLEKSYTAGSLFDTFSTMSKEQVQDFCRKNSVADVTGIGTIREIKKTSAAESIIGIYSISVECGKDTWAVIESKMTDNYRSNFSVGGGVSFTGTLKTYEQTPTRKTI